MQVPGQYEAWELMPGTATSPRQRNTSSPPLMAASVNGPVDPMEFYQTSYSPSPPPEPLNSTLSPATHAARRAFTHGNAGAAGRYTTNSAERAYSRSPTRGKLRSASGPASGAANKALSSVKSQPVLLPSRQPGNVKDIASRFNQVSATSSQPGLAVRTSNEKYRRDPGKSRAPSSPTRGSTGIAKLQKKRPPQTKATEKSPETSFESATSVSSTTTVMSTKSQPHAAFSSKRPKQMEQTTSRPLFGEITSDGRWNGNFDLDGYGPLPTFQPSMRRVSDGNLALSHGRSQSHHDIAPHMSAHATASRLYHKRSRSDMDYGPAPAPSMPNLNTQNIPLLHASGPLSAAKTGFKKESPTSRIPVSSRRASSDSLSTPHSRAASAMSTRATSAMSNHAGRTKLSKSPTRKQHAMNKENEKPAPLQSRRYNPPPLSLPNNQMLSAKIVAPLPKTSPPLRSSRPRQPVSSATTAASRARAAGDKNQNAASKRPSEQWLGKPYDPQKERTRRKIPELGNVDFAERRARIQKAISQNLEESESQESSRTESRNRSRIPSDRSTQASEGASQEEGVNEVDQHQADEFNRETEGMYSRQSQEALFERPRGLSLDTTAASAPLPASSEPEPMTAGTEHTEFEFDESPTLGRSSQEVSDDLPQMQEEQPTLLSAATYQPTPIQKAAPQIEEDVIPDLQERPARNSLLENVMIMRQRSPSTASRSGDSFQNSVSADDSPSDIEDRWGLGTAFTAEGSIKIMLDDDATAGPQHSNEPPWAKDFEQAYHSDSFGQNSEVDESQSQNQDAFAANDWDEESPVKEALQEDDLQITPRRSDKRAEDVQSTGFQPTTGFAVSSDDLASSAAISQAWHDYQSTGVLAPELLQEVQKHTVDLDRTSHNGGSDAIMVQNLLDSIATQRLPVTPGAPKDATLQRTQYEIPAVTPDTPPDARLAMGTAVVFGSDASYDSEVEKEEGDFAVQIRKANEQWERQQNGDDTEPGADEDMLRPTPPPKDEGYTPRSSVGPDSATLPPHLLARGLRISTSGDLGLHEIHAAGSAAASAAPSQAPSPTSTPPQPNHAPPPPPPLAFGMPGVPQIPASYSERGSSELSPRMRKNVWGPSPGSSRPSTDSQRLPHMPASVSMTSFGGSTRVASEDAAGDASSKLGKTTSPSPEYKRLQKRRHIIMELLNTENSYHQDLKIIEDIYKATVGDFVSPEDKKTLFGNCDEIERFSLHFYDDLRKAVASVYTPGKKAWSGKRGSQSTTQSDGTAWSMESLDEEKDRGTTIGGCFVDNLTTMETIYGAYLRNHDAANQRLSALQGTPTVKCWLDECHNNASDITSAWDLDSLLVKPTQRVAKYPLMLQQLLEATPTDHPDHDALKAASKDSIAMLTRINDAKKRADIVEQLISRKGKESDVRTGLAKAFGRRTEKLRERVGINEAFQDSDFDALAHKFGGHYIRLQICMRDVQNYVNNTDKAVEQIGSFAAALELYADVSHSSLPEVASKWRRYGHAIRDLTATALAEHKATTFKRVITPMIACIKLHENPQGAIAKRKKRIVDYARCKSIEKRGEKPDKKTVEAAEMYEALNDQLKIELPRLYDLTAQLVRSCLNCFLDIQLHWQDTWQRKLRPLLEEADVPEGLQDIAPAFYADYDIIRSRITELGICNGSSIADSANFLSPTNTITGETESSLKKKSSTISRSRRGMSVDSEGSPSVQTPSSSKRHSGTYTPDTNALDIAILPDRNRMRSSSSVSNRGPSIAPTSAGNLAMSNRPWSNSNATQHASYSNMTPSSSFSTSRPTTATHTQSASYLPTRASADRPSTDYPQQSPRPASGQTYFTARPDQSIDPNSHRFSGIFSSALPPDLALDPNIPSYPAIKPSSTTTTTAATATPSSPRQPATAETKTLWVCASLFEFNIDKSRKEGGYPYLTYDQGEVFDVVAQKGELWLAKNQDDAANTLGWIWEQHFVVLSQD